MIPLSSGMKYLEKENVTHVVKAFDSHGSWGKIILDILCIAIPHASELAKNANAFDDPANSTYAERSRLCSILLRQWTNNQMEKPLEIEAQGLWYSTKLLLNNQPSKAFLPCWPMRIIHVAFQRKMEKIRHSRFATNLQFLNLFIKMWFSVKFLIKNLSRQ